MYCTTSRLAIFNHEAFEAALAAKLKRREAEEGRLQSTQSKGRKGGKRRGRNTVKPPQSPQPGKEEGRMVSLPTKRVSFLIENKSLAVLYGTIVL